MLISVHLFCTAHFRIITCAKLSIPGLRETGLQSIYIIYNKYINKRLHVTVYGRRSASAGAATVVIIFVVVVIGDGRSMGLRAPGGCDYTYRTRDL